MASDDLSEYAPPPYLAIGNNELGEDVTETAECPRCHEQHPLTYGTSNGVEYRGIGFVRCGEASYLASLDGRQVRR